MLRVVLVFLAMLFPLMGARAASLQAMAGQMVMVGFKGSHVDDPGVQALVRDIAEGRIGGLIYLRNNISSLLETGRMNGLFQRSAGDLPVLIALDQEGGSIERLTKAVGFTEIPSAARIAARRSVAEAEQIYAGMASGLANLGFNLNLGPVVDLNINPDNPIIARYGRSFGDEAPTVAAYAGSFIVAHHRAGVLTALKHFPGHGSAHGDSHEGFVDITRYWQPRELDPYRILIGKGLVDVIMTAHLYHRDYAGGRGVQLPASLSENWIGKILRRDLGYDGVVISDDMEMGAIRAHFSLRDAVVRAVNAGTDILLFSNTANYRTSLAREVVRILIVEAQGDAGFRRRIEESYRRIVALKGRLPR